MCWPTRDELYGELLAEARRAHAEVARTIAGFEPVTMIAAPGQAEAAAGGVWRRRRGRRAGDRRLVVPRHADRSTSTDDGGRRVALDWEFNAWGGKFTPYDDDATIARRWAEHAGHDVRSIPVVIEGGAHHRRRRRHARHDGAVPAAPEPQPVDVAGRDRGTVLGDELGVSTIVWLPHGLALDDDTDGHVDNVAAFARPGALVVQGCDDVDEDDWLRCDVNVRCARGALDAAGRAARGRRGPDAAVHRGARRAGRRAVPQLLRRQRRRGRAGVRPRRRRRHARPHRRAVPRTARSSASTSAPSSPTAAAASTASPSRSRRDRPVVPRPARGDHGRRRGVAARLPARRQDRRRAAAQRLALLQHPGRAQQRGRLVPGEPDRRCRAPSTAR